MNETGHPECLLSLILSRDHQPIQDHSAVPIGSERISELPSIYLVNVGLKRRVGIFELRAAWFGRDRPTLAADHG